MKSKISLRTMLVAATMGAMVPNQSPLMTLPEPKIASASAHKRHKRRMYKKTKASFRHLDQIARGFATPNDTIKERANERRAKRAAWRYLNYFKGQSNYYFVNPVT